MLYKKTEFRDIVDRKAVLADCSILSCHGDTTTGGHAI
jgi:hypothetical protein